MEVDSTDDIGDRIKRRPSQRRGRQSRARRAAKKGVSRVAREQNALCAKINPVVRKVRKINAPILKLLLDVSFEAESI